MYQTHNVSSKKEKKRPSWFNNQEDSWLTTHHPAVLHGNTMFTLDLSRDQCVQRLQWP